jgi:hypothetical protein
MPEAPVDLKKAKATQKQELKSKPTQKNATDRIDSDEDFIYFDEESSEEEKKIELPFNLSNDQSREFGARKK